MGNCCKDQEVVSRSDDVLGTILRSSGNKSGQLKDSEHSLIAIDEEGQWCGSSEDLDRSFDQKETQKGTIFTYDQSIDHHFAQCYKQHSSADGEYFHKITPSLYSKPEQDDLRSRRYSEEYKPHQLPSSQEMDLRGTSLKLSNKKKFQAGLSVISQVSPLCESSEAGKTNLSSSSGHLMRLSIINSGRSKTLNGSQTSIRSSQRRSLHKQKEKCDD